MEEHLPHNEAVKERTRYKALRMHQGPGHWHVRIRSNVIVCGNCEARISKHLNPRFCPECGDGR